MTTRTVYGGLRLLTAAVCAIALVHRYFWALGGQTVASENYFAYLTIQSNIAFTVLAVIAGVVALRRAEDPRWLTTARAIVLSWTITAGAAYGVILWQALARGIPIWVAWSDIVLHFVLPVWTLAAWTFGPGRRRASWRVVPLVLIYPVAWGVFTLIRGHHIEWYPYYFLDLRLVSGLPEMILSCALALSAFAIVATGLVGLSRLRTSARVDRARLDALHAGEHGERLAHEFGDPIVIELAEGDRVGAPGKAHEDRLAGSRA